MQRIFARLKAGKSAETIKVLGRPRKLTLPLRRQLAQIKARHPFKSSFFYAQRLSRMNNVPVSVRSVQRGLHELGYSWRLPRHRLLTSSQKRERVAFCYARRADAWGRRRSGDETTFNLWRAGNRCWVRYSKRTGEDFPNKPVLSHKMEKISVTVVGIIGRGEKSALAFLPKGWAGADLVSVFDSVVYPSLIWSRSIYEPHELMWDNDDRHHQRVWNLYAAEKQLRPLTPWPSNSPDLNPIENVWRWLKDNVESMEPTSEQELKDCIQKAWLDIPVEHTVTLMDSMPRRLEACLRLNGGRIQY